MSYNVAQFQQYTGYEKEMKMKHTHTEPQQAENMNEKQDVHSEGNTHDIGRVTSIPNVDIETDNIQEAYGALIFVAQKRELNGKSPSNYTV